MFILKHIQMSVVDDFAYTQFPNNFQHAYLFFVYRYNLSINKIVSLGRLFKSFMDKRHENSTL